MSNPDGLNPKDGLEKESVLRNPEDAETKEDFKNRLIECEKHIIDRARSSETCNRDASKLAESFSPDDLKGRIKALGSQTELAQKYEGAVFGKYENDGERQDSISRAAADWEHYIEDKEVLKMAVEKFEPSVNWDKVKAAIAMPIIAFGIGHDAGTLPVEAAIGEKQYEKIMGLPPDPFPSDRRPADLLKHRPLTQALDGIFKDLENGKEIKKLVIPINAEELAAACSPPPDQPAKPDGITEKTDNKEA